MALWQTINVKNASVKKCAFCKNWYDPTNTAIRPKNAPAGFWEFDPEAQKPCMKRPGDKRATFYCSQFQCKIGS